jgi:hypothetical protein
MRQVLGGRAVGPMTTQRRHESPELGATVRRMVRALVRRAAEGDTEALEQLAQLELELPTATSCALALMNARTSTPVYSFTELANVLGTTRQAARQRAVRITTDDQVASYYSDGASESLDWAK